MGVPPYVLASSIDIILAQRLVRKVCPHCATTYMADPKETEMIKWMMKDIGIEAVAKMKRDGFKLWRGAGCDVCGHTGYK